MEIIVWHGLLCTRFVSLLVTHSTAVPSLILLPSSLLHYLADVFHAFALCQHRKSSNPTPDLLCAELCKTIDSSSLFFMLASATGFAPVFDDILVEYFRGCGVIAERRSKI